MSKLFTRATVSGASLSGANLKAALTALWDALNTAGLTDSTRTTVTATGTLATTQCGLLLVDATSGNIVLTLPSSGATTDDAIYNIRRIDSTANTVTVQRGGTDTIDGGTSLLVPALGVLELQMPAGATQWRVWGICGSTPAAARLSLGTAPTRRVMGLLGVNNTTTPTTKLDLSADSVVLADANGATVTRNVTGTITCDFGLAGPAVNGRDQAGAFSASNWVRVFFIWNGTTLATVASLASQTTGPTLPSGYTHWAYAATVYWNGSSNIVPVFVRGSRMQYKGAQSALAAGTAGAATSVSLTALVPPEALRFGLVGSSSHLFVTSSAGGVADVTANVGTSGTEVPHTFAPRSLAGPRRAWWGPSAAWSWPTWASSSPTTLAPARALRPA